MNLSGQTGMRVDAHWATQAAILQGFAQFQSPDLVLREDRLAEGLAFLAAEVGKPAPEGAAPRPVFDDVLVSIYDADLEDAARDTYARDYIAFGFQDWRKA